MSTRRFQVTLVPESNSLVHAAEMIPLIEIENEIPSPPPLPASLSSTNGNQVSSRASNPIVQNKSFNVRRRATIAAAMAFMGSQIKKSSSANVFHTIDTTSTNLETENENGTAEFDVYSTTQSNNYDTNPSGLTNKFLQELRSKRREFRDKAKNISIDQRIAFHRRANQRVIRRAQDIFDVHFELHDEEDNLPTTEINFFTEESQEKIRKDIFNELDRQRKKHYHKQHQHLLLGRSLLAIMTLLLIFMGLTLTYVVIDLYDRARHLDAKLPENEFISMINDKTTKNLY